MFLAVLVVVEGDADGGGTGPEGGTRGFDEVAPDFDEAGGGVPADPGIVGEVGEEIAGSEGECGVHFPAAAGSGAEGGIGGGGDGIVNEVVGAIGVSFG